MDKNKTYYKSLEHINKYNSYHENLLKIINIIEKIKLINNKKDIPEINDNNYLKFLFEQIEINIDKQKYLNENLDKLEIINNDYSKKSVHQLFNLFISASKNYSETINLFDKLK